MGVFVVIEFLYLIEFILIVRGRELFVEGGRGVGGGRGKGFGEGVG